MNDKDFLMNKSTIVSASPFRAVIRRNMTGPESRVDDDTYRKHTENDSDEGEEEDGDDFERDINEHKEQHSMFKTGRL